ncbi:SpdD-like protein [Streptomyces sp. WAC 05379]|uniref:SpdD-like protein n=1 Tax=Streptomyces sp. WAC 05379 TaxID=2203207 RepID=UPI000F7488A0|nr:SpdD-like protein [Streptomyces sp. WAC 05379]RSN91143.1 SpdD-like protein [Streptomyces sp. WAC 05379]
MLRPRVPVNEKPTGEIIPTITTLGSVVPHDPGQAPCDCRHHAPAASRPTVQLTPGTVLALVGGGTAVVLVVGAVLVSMLLAVAITGASVAVCAVVLRSLLASEAKRR